METTDTHDPIIHAGEDEVVLKLDGAAISPSHFIRAVKAFFTLVNSATTATTGDHNNIAWSVKVREGSNVVIAKGANRRPADDVLSVRAKISEEFARVRRGEKVLPTELGPKGAESFRQLVHLLNDELTPSGIVNVALCANGHGVSAAGQVAKDLKKAEEGFEESYGTVEGRVRTLTEHRGLHFTLLHELTGESIPCYFPESMKQIAREAFGHRVAAFGLIQRGLSQKPSRVDVKRIDLLDIEPVPTIKDIRGLFS